MTGAGVASASVDVTVEPVEAFEVFTAEIGLESLAPEEALQVRTHSWHRYLAGWFEGHLSTKETSR